MQSKIFIHAILFFFSFSALAQNISDRDERILDNPVFVFNNAFFKNRESSFSYSQVAATLKKLGYNGIEHRETDGITEMRMALEKEGLKLYADYLKIDIDKDEPYLPEWKETIPKLEGTNIILWVHIHSEKYKPSDESADEKIIPVLQELADLAKPYGVRVAVYPHVNFLAEKAEDSYRLATKANRENVGSVFNLCHFLKTDSEENIEKVINLTFPKLFAVSVNGADYGNTRLMDWDRLIQPLGEGSFDVYRVVELLAEKGYNGPFGIQCYNIPGNPEDFLAKSSQTWKNFRQTYSIPLSTLTKKEKEQGWELLFDGISTEKWRGINKDSFPSYGWKVEEGALVSNSNNGAESANGGDIITKKQYKNFILKWEWKMKTKGGNSGVKYFVHEGIGENKGYGFGLEYQILDDKYHPWMLQGKMKPDDYHTMGSLYEIYPASPGKRTNPLGLWNESMIVCTNDTVQHWLNGKKILEFIRASDDFKTKIAESKFKSVEGFGLWQQGHILLQDHGSIVHFRNIKIKEI